MHTLAFAESIQLFPDGTLFIHIALILLMIWILNRTLFRPINRVLESREKQTAGEGEAALILKDVSAKESKYNAEMLDARTTGYTMIENEHAAATVSRSNQLAEVKAETAETFGSGKSEIERQTTEVRATIGAEADKMADDIVASILQK